MDYKKLKEKINVLPEIIKYSKDQIKDNFEENGKEILNSSSGLVGIFIKLFAKDSIDKYYENKQKKKLQNNAMALLLKSSFEQVQKSIESIGFNLPTIDSKELLMYYIDIIQKTYTDTYFEKLSIELESSFEINYLHSYPPISFPRDTVEEALRSFDINNDIIDEFVFNFNKNIVESISHNLTDEEFKKLLKQIENNKIEFNELKFLQKMERLRRIGFQGNENLTYMPTYGYWKMTSEYRTNDNIDEYDIDEIEENEKNLVQIENLINQYFDLYLPEETLKKILFIISDFGKGKSTFLKHYASELAYKYLRRGKSEYFPVYFNLNDFNNKNYFPDHSYGIIASYLSVNYGVQIESDNYKDTKFFFLIDSLDESGDLDKHSIDKVIKSIRKIQTLNEFSSRNNRIIITSRPIDNVLLEHLDSYCPYKINNKNGSLVNMFISIHGFKSNQFNEWLKESIKNSNIKDITSLTNFSKNIVLKIKTDENIHNYILDNRLLKASELQRPIFAYMIYKLILGNVDFSSIEKIGIYLSFLNILTKDAKHTNDINISVNLNDEFNFRNILHYISVLWLKQKEINNNNTLSREDICRTIKGKIPDNENIENCKDIRYLKFLSHSYFGNEGDKLYFNHQSFAEMLLAEYYLKVFIKFALDCGESSIEDARVMLSIGTPTEQTMIFFKELLNLFKNSIKNDDPNIKKMREMLVKFLASCSITKNNRLVSNKLNLKWYEDYEEDILKEKCGLDKLIENWPINQEVLDKIIKLSEKIISQKNTISFTKGRNKNSVFDTEVIVFRKNLSTVVPDIDKWISLITGNILYNNLENEIFFNSSIQNQSELIEIIKNWNLHKKESSPIWASNYFNGVKFENEKLKSLNLGNLDFSYSSFIDVDFSHSTLHKTIFDFCSFENIDFSYLNAYNASFKNIVHLNNFNFSRSNIAAGLIYPTSLSVSSETVIKEKIVISDDSRYNSYLLDQIVITLGGFFEVYLRDNIFTKEQLINAFTFENIETNQAYKDYILSLSNTPEDESPLL